MLFRVVKDENFEEFKGFTADQKYIASSFAKDVPGLQLKKELMFHEKKEDQARLECKIINKMYNVSIIATFKNGLFQSLFVKNNITGYTSSMIYTDYLEGAKQWIDRTMESHVQMQRDFVSLLNH